MTADEQLQYLAKGTVDLIEKADLKAKIERGKPLTVKVESCTDYVKAKLDLLEHAHLLGALLPVPVSAGDQRRRPAHHLHPLRGERVGTIVT